MLRKLLWITLCSALVTTPLSARDLNGKYADSKFKNWFDHLQSKKGLCCSVADGITLSDIQWRYTGKQFEVFALGQWRKVPPDTVITEPNLFGQAVVWFLTTIENGKSIPTLDGNGEPIIQCFIPGAMT